jgi:Carboxypeptidase regulatory-like domain
MFNRLPIAIILVLCSMPFARAADSPSISGAGNAPSDVISGRILDASAVPIKGNVVIALEKQDDGSIVNETSPDAKGNFTFAQVGGGDYVLFIAAQNDKQVAYAPVVLLSAGSTFGTGQTISPGTNVGVIKLPLARGASSGTVPVPVNSDHPITVTLAAHITYNGHTFEWPWINGIPTFDVPARNRRANTIQVPAAPAFIGVYNADATRFAQNTGSSVDLYASAYTQNGAKPTCVPAKRGPNRVDASAGRNSPPAGFNFIGCQ